MPQYVSLDQQGFYKPFEMAGQSMRAAIEAYQRNKQIEQHQQELDDAAKTHALQREQMSQENEARGYDLRQRRIQDAFSEADPDSVANKFKQDDGTYGVQRSPAHTIPGGTRSVPNAATPPPKTQQSLDASVDGSTGGSNGPSAAATVGDVSNWFNRGAPSAQDNLTNSPSDWMKNPNLGSDRIAKQLASDTTLGAPSSSVPPKTLPAPAAPASLTAVPDTHTVTDPDTQVPAQFDTIDPTGPLSKQPVEYQKAIYNHYKGLVSSDDAKYATPLMIAQAYRNNQISKQIAESRSLPGNPNLTTTKISYVDPATGATVEQQNLGSNGRVLLDQKQRTELIGKGQEAYGKVWEENYNDAKAAQDKIEEAYAEANKQRGHTRNTAAQDQTMLKNALVLMNPKSKINPSTEEHFEKYQSSWPSKYRKKWNQVIGGNGQLDDGERDELRDQSRGTLGALYSSTKNAADRTANRYGIYGDDVPDSVRYKQEPEKPSWGSTETSGSSVPATGSSSASKSARFNSLAEANAAVKDNPSLKQSGVWIKDANGQYNHHPWIGQK
jgi:hypothetical protein